MSATYATPLALHIKPSRRLRGFILLINMLAILSCLLLPMDLVIRMGLCLLFVFSALYGLKRWSQCYRLVWREHDWLVIEPRRERIARLDQSTLVTAWLTILNLRLDDGARLSVPILPDAIHPDDFRRLRVRLKVQGRQSTYRAKLES